MPKFAIRDQRFGAPDIMWGPRSDYGHISIYSWSQKSHEMNALSNLAAAAMAARIVAFLNESEPSAAERDYEAAVDAGRV